MSAALSAPKIDKTLLANLARTIRGLCIDGVEKANSGHPGMPLGCADFAALLWYYHLRFDPKAPHWADRDRFVLSAGHGSMLLYSLLHLSGFSMPMEQLQRFRQLGSVTPGHPENFLAEGIETTTGPLGQGFANGVGMALAAEMMAARFPELITHRIYGIVSDGDLMEGVAAEAASFAGHHGLGRIVYFYDDNKITIEGETSLTFSGESVAKRFEAYGWHVLHADGHNFDEMNHALAEAAAVTDRPSLIVGRTHIGFGSPHMQDTSEVHGSPLGPEEAKKTKENLGLPTDKAFYVPDADRASWSERAAAGAKEHLAWANKFNNASNEVRDSFESFLTKPTPDLVAKRPKHEANSAAATRKTAGQALNAYAPLVPWLVGGSADLAPSTLTLIKGSPDVGHGKFEGRNLHFGIREHGMAGIMNGMALSGFFKPYGATFLVFSDYARPSIRLAALMGVPAIFVFTHDSIFLGEDGPTHQPIEHLAALRAIPELVVIRPCDGDEASVAWEYAIKQTKAPIALILTRQNVPNLTRGEGALATADGLEKGGYILFQGAEITPRVIIIATGSEVGISLDAARALEKKGLSTRVVSMPSVELFKQQPKNYRDSVLPPSVRNRVVVEAGIKMGWEEFAGDHGAYVCLESWGASAPAKDLAKHFGITAEAVMEKAMGLLKKNSSEEETMIGLLKKK